jgi:hypothetical protein
VEGEQATDLVQAWQKLLGGPLTARELLSAWDPTDYASFAHDLVESIVTTEIMSEPTGPVVQRATRLGGASEGRQRAMELACECNYRCAFNQRLAILLQKPYLPNSFRLPYQRAQYEWAVKIQSELASLRVIEDWYGHIPGPPDQNLRLPFFLAAIVKRAERPSDVFEILADIRRQATGFRARRAELDAALRTAAQPRQQLIAALEDEARGLLGRFPYVPAMAGIAAILAQAVEPDVGLTLPLICVACLTAGSRLPGRAPQIHRSHSTAVLLVPATPRRHRPRGCSRLSRRAASLGSRRGGRNVVRRPLRRAPVARTVSSSHATDLSSASP